MKQVSQFEREYVGHMGRDYSIVLDSKQPIIRCKDCRFYEPNTYSHFTCEMLMYHVEPDGFCAWGESREGHVINNELVARETTVDNAQADSRERLEADVYDGFSDVDLPEQMRDVLRARVHGWLDRQAAITEREFWECYANGNQWEARQYELRCEELTAERDRLRSECTAELLEAINKATGILAKKDAELKIMTSVNEKLRQELKEARDETN